MDLNPINSFILRLFIILLYPILKSRKLNNFINFNSKSFECSFFLYRTFIYKILRILISFTIDKLMKSLYISLFYVKFQYTSISFLYFKSILTLILSVLTLGEKIVFLNFSRVRTDARKQKNSREESRTGLVPAAWGIPGMASLAIIVFFRKVAEVIRCIYLLFQWCLVLYVFYIVLLFLSQFYQFDVF